MLIYMTDAQYMRIEAKAGGIAATPREFVRAAHTLLSNEARHHSKREWRHAWLRDGLALLKTMKRI